MANEKYISKIVIEGENYDLKTKQPDWSETNTDDPGYIKNKPTLGTAAEKGVDTSPISDSENLITSGGVYSAIQSKADLENGKVPASQLPSYVDDVLEYSSTSSFPATGESGKIYVATDTNKTYRWGGSAYVEISESLALGETASTAYAGNKGKANADAIAAIKDGTTIDSFADVETALSEMLNVQFTQANTFENITSGENISTSFGKLARWYSEINKKIDTEATYADIEALFPKPYLTFRGTAPFTLATANGGNWDGTVEYSTNLSTWETWNGTTTLYSGKGNVLYLRGKNNTRFATSSTDSECTNFAFTTDGTIECNGDIRRLLDYENPEDTTMASYCYYSMFAGCTSLTTAPDLPATILASGCYRFMFKGCTSLTTLPALPATILASGCYYGMFQNCTNIKISTTKTGDYQTSYRIPTTGTGADATNAMAYMFIGTGGTFTDTPTINTTYYTSNTVVSAS